MPQGNPPYRPFNQSHRLAPSDNLALDVGIPAAASSPRTAPYSESRPSSRSSSREARETMIQRAGQGNPGPASCKRQVGVSQSSSCVSQHNPSAPGRRQASTCNTCESTHGPCRLGEHPYKPLSPVCKHVCLSACVSRSGVRAWFRRDLSVLCQ